MWIGAAKGGVRLPRLALLVRRPAVDVEEDDPNMKYARVSRGSIFSTSDNEVYIS